MCSNSDECTKFRSDYDWLYVCPYSHWINKFPDTCRPTAAPNTASAAEPSCGPDSLVGSPSHSCLCAYRDIYRQSAHLSSILGCLLGGRDVPANVLCPHAISPDT